MKKLMIASDIHGSAYYCRKMLEAFDREQADRLIYATHGHHFHMNQLPPLQPGDILLHGHTHIPAWESFGDGNLYLNPGSVSIPKAESEHSYMLLQDGKVIWKTLEGTTYHSECL